jgi:hypothetical protein
MDYFKTVKESFDIWWKNKYLWILGVIAVIFSGSSSGTSNMSSNSGDLESFNQTYNELLPIISVVIVVIVCIALIMTFVSIYLKSRADASLISSVALIEKGDKLGFRKSWGLSSSKWVKLFLLNLLLSIPIILIVLLIVILIVIAIATSSSSNLDSTMLLFMLLGVGIPLFCLIILYSVFSNIIYTFASRVSVLNNGAVWDSVKKAWTFISENFSNIVVFWLISLVIGMVTGTVSAIVGFVIFIPIVLLGAGLFIINLWVGIIVGFILLMLASAVLSLLSGPIYSFGEIYWTKVYLTLKKENA